MFTKKIALLLLGFFLTLSLSAGAAQAFSPGQGGGMVALTGKVVETMNSGGYTYVLLEQEGAKTWAAIPQTNAVVGETITLRPGLVMPSFTSKTLDRTFENIIFSAGPAQ